PFLHKPRRPPDPPPPPLHDALPIFEVARQTRKFRYRPPQRCRFAKPPPRTKANAGLSDWNTLQSREDAGRDKPAFAFVRGGGFRSEEHTSELQSLTNLVCRLLLENN